MSTQPGDQTTVMPPARGAAAPGPSFTPAPGPQAARPGRRAGGLVRPHLRAGPGHTVPRGTRGLRPAPGRRLAPAPSARAER